MRPRSTALCRAATEHARRGPAAAAQELSSLSRPCEERHVSASAHLRAEGVNALSGAIFCEPCSSWDDEFRPTVPSLLNLLQTRENGQLRGLLPLHSLEVFSVVSKVSCLSRSSLRSRSLQWGHRAVGNLRADPREAVVRCTACKTCLRLRSAADDARRRAHATHVIAMSLTAVEKFE